MSPLAILLAIVASAPWLLLAVVAGRDQFLLGMALAVIGTGVCVFALSLGQARAR